MFFQDIFRASNNLMSQTLNLNISFLWLLSYPNPSDMLYFGERGGRINTNIDSVDTNAGTRIWLILAQ